MDRVTWTEVAEFIRRSREHQELARNCYLDDPATEAAARFVRSPEWEATRALLPPRKGKVLELAAGRGIAGYALAHEGWTVTAAGFEGTGLVGVEAVRSLVAHAAREVNVVQAREDNLPFAAGSFDLVYARAVLHRAEDLDRVCHEAWRVLRPQGVFCAIREHVLSKPRNVGEYLKKHSYYDLCRGEKAFPVSRYVEAFRGAGFDAIEVIGPYDSVINYFPMSYNDWWSACTQTLERFLGARAARALTSQRHWFGVQFMRYLARRASHRCETPGRRFSFVAHKTR